MRIIQGVFGFGKTGRFSVRNNDDGSFSAVNDKGDSLKNFQNRAEAQSFVQSKNKGSSIKRGLAYGAGAALGVGAAGYAASKTDMGKRAMSNAGEFGKNTYKRAGELGKNTYKRAGELGKRGYEKGKGFVNNAVKQAQVNLSNWRQPQPDPGYQRDNSAED